MVVCQVAATLHCVQKFLRWCKGYSHSMVTCCCRWVLVVMGVVVVVTRTHLSEWCRKHHWRR